MYLYSIFLVYFTHLFVKMAKSEELCSCLMGFPHLFFNHDESEQFKSVFYQDIKVIHCSKYGKSELQHLSNIIK